MVVKYLSRILDKDLEKYLTMIGAILIVGPKWCGKTTTAEQHAKSVLKLQNKDNYKTNMMWADIEPSRLLKGEKPRLIDEWQWLLYCEIPSEQAWMKAKDMDYIF